MSNVAWSDDRVTILSKLWLQGLSAAQVARHLGGVTRNAVIGKVHRLGLADRGVASAPTRVARVTKRRDPRPPPQVMPAPRRRTEARSVPASALLPEAPGLVRDLLHLGVHACKWPIGDPKSAAFSFCGAKTDGRYCNGHERLDTKPGKTVSPIDRDPVVRRALAGLV
jgi:GcrA cell cycle regulator